MLRGGPRVIRVQEWPAEPRETGTTRVIPRRNIEKRLGLEYALRRQRAIVNKIKIPGAVSSQRIKGW